MSIFDQVSNDIKAAMLAKDKVKLEALRNAKKYFLEAKTAPGADDLLTDEAALKILQKLVKQGRESARIYTEQRRADLAEAELEQVKALEGEKNYCSGRCNFTQRNGQSDGGCFESLIR